MNLLRSVLGWVRRQVVDDVPPENALCEFDCRKPQCSTAEWETCERRLENAGGQLMPKQEPAAQPDSLGD